MALPALAVGMMAAGTAVNAFGAYSAGKAKQAAYNYDAQVAEMNAGIAKEQAEFEAARQESKTRRFIASQRVGFLANGVTISGSAMDILSDTTIQGEMDRLAIIYGGEVEAVNYRNDAQRSRFAGKQEAKAGMFNAAGSLLSGAGSAYGTGISLGLF